MLRLQKYSYRFAEQVLNGRLSLKDEIETIITDPSIDIPSLSRRHFNEVLEEKFVAKGWKSQPYVFNEEDAPMAKLDFIKDRVGIEVEFGHASFIGIDLLKFQVSSYSSLDKIDVGIHIVTTRNFQNYMMKTYNQNWEGSLTFEKVKMYLPYFKSSIQIPIYVLGFDI
jgi:hypothetical protein